MRELRALHFDKEEVARTVIAHRLKRGETLPRGTLDGITILHRHGMLCRMTIRDDFGMGHDVEAAEAEIAASLIEHCIEKRVPVPRRARKTVEDMDGGVLLVFHLEGGGAPLKRPRTTVVRRPLMGRGRST